VLSLTIDLPLQTIYWVNNYGPGIGYCPLDNCTEVRKVKGPFQRTALMSVIAPTHGRMARLS